MITSVWRLWFWCLLSALSATTASNTDMVSTLMERWLKNCRGGMVALCLSRCPSIHQKPDNLTYFFVVGPWHWRFIRGLCWGHPGFRRYPNTSLQVMHNGNILYTVSQRCLLLCNFLTWETPCISVTICCHVVCCSSPPPPPRPLSGALVPCPKHRCPMCRMENARMQRWHRGYERTY